MMKLQLLLSLRTFVFELWIENIKLFGNMDMVVGLAAFFHLCFVFDFLYPKVLTMKLLFFFDVLYIGRSDSCRDASEGCL